MLRKNITILENVHKFFTRRIFKKFSLPRISYIERSSVLNKVSLERRGLILSLTTLYNMFHKYIACGIISDFHCLHNNLRGNSKREFFSFANHQLENHFVNLNGSLFIMDCSIV